jgi:hypothetical protein
MGLKISKALLLLCTLLSAFGCGAPGLDNWEGDNIFYQVYPGKKDIIRMRYTLDKGSPSIQLFDKHGSFLEESAIAPNSILRMTSIANDSIQITYFVGQSDLDMFLAWFTTNKFNPKRIGNYSIHYNYEIHNTYLENKGSEIDSVAIDGETHMASVFLKHELIAKKPCHLFIVKQTELLLYDPASKTYTPYTFTNKNLLKEYLRKNLDVSNRK